MQLRIPQIVTKSGYKFWALVCHPQTLAKLWTDSTFQNAQREAWSTKMLDSPELNGAVASYAGFCIYEDIVGIRQWHNTNIGVDGVTGTFFGTTHAQRMEPTALATTYPYNSIVFGNSAIGKGVAEAVHFTDEVDDHKNTIEVGAAMINGYNRADFVAESVSGDGTLGSTTVFSKANTISKEFDTAGVAATNQSSLIIATMDN